MVAACRGGARSHLQSFESTSAQHEAWNNICSKDEHVGQTTTRRAFVVSTSRRHKESKDGDEAIAAIDHQPKLGSYS